MSSRAQNAHTSRPLAPHTSTPLRARPAQAKLNQLQPSVADAPLSPLPPSSPLAALTSDPAPQLTSPGLGPEYPSSPATNRANAADPFGFFAVEKQLKARKERCVLQPRAAPNLGVRAVAAGEEEEAESDGRPAFATPPRGPEAPSSAASSSSGGETPLGRSRGSESVNAPTSSPRSKETTARKKDVGRKRLARAAKSKSKGGRKGTGAQTSDEETEKGKENVNVFAPSSDYLDTLPRPRPRRAKAVVPSNSTRAGRGRMGKVTQAGAGASRQKTKTGSETGRSRRAGNAKTKTNRRVINKLRDGDSDQEDEDGGGGEARDDARVGESFVLDGEEREQFEADRAARRAYFAEVDAFKLKEENVYVI